MTIKSLTILDIDLIDSNEAILVLNNLPNVQVLNGKSTKEDEEEEFEEEENNENINSGNHLEEIQEDKNMENNSNYISNENNMISNDISPRNNFTPKTEVINKNNLNGNINKNEIEPNNNIMTKINSEVQNNEDNIEKPKTVLYDKIMSDESNKKIISNTDTDNKEENIDKQKIDKSYYFSKFMIDITNEELNLLNEEKNNFPIFLQEFSELFPKNEENNLINIYIEKIKDIENKKGNIPNYYYFYLILKKKISILKNLFDEMFPFILNNCPELNKNDIFIKLYTEIIKIITSSKQLMLSLHRHIESYNNKSNIENQNETNYNNELNNIIKDNNETISKMESEKNSLLKIINDDKNRYELKIKKLEKENEIITNKLINNMNLNLKTPYSTINLGKNKINLNNNNNIKDKSYKSKSPKNKSFENTKINKSPYKSNMSTLSMDNNLNLKTIHPGSVTSKRQSISLKALKEFINELYISKNNYNIKCEQFKIPKETLEEHMYTFLNKKYGLKKIVIEWAKNIIQGIKQYSKIDSTVLLFAKILKNEQEEEAQFIIPKVIKNIQDLLKFYLKKQNPLKSLNEINKIFGIKINSELYEEEWKGIIYSIYEKNEAEEIQKKIENHINIENNLKKSENFQKYKSNRMNMYSRYNNNIIINNTESNNNRNDNFFYLNTINSLNNGLSNSSFNNRTISPNYKVTNKMTRSEKYNMLLIQDNKSIMYKDFIRIVLNSHIRFRDRQLKNFVKLFQSVDLDRDGILNEEEFGELVQKMNIFKVEEIESKIFYFLERIDPFDNQKITFSECISFFSREFISENNENGNGISILEKICFNNKNDDENDSKKNL